MIQSVPQRRTVWPTAAELDLLHAALDDGAAARATWDRWRIATGGIPDAPARRLLPLVEWNLRRESSVGIPLQDGLVERGVALARAIADATAPVLEALRRAGSRPVLIKGLGLAHLVYPHPALRPMSDVDILVRPEDFRAARKILEELGWRATEPEPEVRLRHLHGTGFAHPGGPEIDLHARALAECGMPGIDRDLFSRATEITIGGVRTETLSAADHFLCVCVHGLRWSTFPPIHWVADALMILRRTSDLDWETLLREAAARRLDGTLSRGFRLLREEFGAEIPDAVIGELARRRLPLQECELAIRMRRPSLPGGLFLHWCGLSQERGELSLWERIWRFPSHLRELWALDHVWQVPAAAIRKSRARLTRRR